MAADCRISRVKVETTENSRLKEKIVSWWWSRIELTMNFKRMKRFKESKSVTWNASVFSVLVLCLFNCSQVCSLYIECTSVKSCICDRSESGGWEILCPNDVRSSYPILIQVDKKLNTTDEASLLIMCDLSQSGALEPWDYIKEIDLSNRQIYAKIVKLEFRYCMPVNDGWSELFRKLNLTAGNIVDFSFVSEFKSNMVIPENFFDYLPNLKYLNLRHNQLTSVPDVSKLENLQILNLRQNAIESLPTGIFSQNKRLTNLALTYNRILDVAPNTFPDSLEHLELNNNYISYLNSSMFSNLKNLKRLYLNNNGLDTMDPDTFNGMLELEELLIYNSKLTQFPSFINLPKLKILKSSTAVYFRTVEPATKENVDGITTTLAPEYLPENVLILKNLPSLEKLDLNLNHFTVIPILENLPKLRDVDLGRNDITEIENGTFKGFPALKTLKLHRNKLERLGNILAPSLEELDLSFNRLSNLSDSAFRSLGSLKKLNLQNNSIQAITYQTFESLSTLEEINLANNQISFTLPYSTMTGEWVPSNQSPLKNSLRLRVINLANNNINTINYSDWSTLFIQLNRLDLRRNKIRSITANDLNFISANLTLNLESNLITRVDMKLAIYLLQSNSDDKQIRVFLADNPINCDCFAFDLKEFKSASYDLRMKDLRCNLPQELKNTTLDKVPNEALVCDLSKEESGCPDMCLCKKRPVDTTIIVDCSNRNLTSLEDFPKPSTFKYPYKKTFLELNFSGNQLSQFNDSVFLKEYLNKTRKIDLTRNMFTSTLFLDDVAKYQPTSLIDNQPFDKSYFTTFALAENPFECSNCAGFQLPWRGSPTRINDLGNVTCRMDTRETDASGHPIYTLKNIQENSNEFEVYCAGSSKYALVLILPLVIAVILLSCLCISLFLTIRYGWAIKAYLYSRGWYWCLFWERDFEEDDETEKLYDAFVSYSHSDEDWVLDELVSKLEGEEGFKLCLHFRDWTPGDWIPDQIVRSVDKSRRTVVVLSKNFVESVWSRLEFKAAHAQALKERSNRVILIMLGEDLKETDVQDDDLKMYMKMNTFMKWNDPLFWHRLKYALPHKKSCNSSTQPTEEELKQNAINKLYQRDQAIRLDKLRAKLEQAV